MTLPTYASGMLFTKAHKLVRQQIYNILAAYNLSPTHWSILSVVAGSRDGIRLSSVAERLSVKAPLVTSEVGELLQQDLVQRLPHHTDKRAKLLVVTRKGKNLTTKIEVELAEHVAHLFSGLSAAEIATFHKALQTIVDNS